MENEKIADIVVQILQESYLNADYEENLAKYEKEPYFDDLIGMFNDTCLDFMTRGYYTYTDKISDEVRKDREIFCKLAKKQGKPYFLAVASFYEGKRERCLSYLKKGLEETFANSAMNESDFSIFLIVPFKNAYKGFWKQVKELLSSIKTEPGVVDLCDVIDCCYYCENKDEIVDLLTKQLQRNMNSELLKELLGYIYYSMQMWNNAIAYFEQLEKSLLFYMDDIYFFLAWSYSKIRNSKQEIEYYKKCLDYSPDHPDALNNLGYAYYREKQYAAALEIFEKCIAEKRDLYCASNNYVRTLLALQRYSEAEKYALNPDNKVTKELLRRIQNAKTKKKSIEKEEIIEQPEVSERKIDFGVKKQQFSNEKLLEDELTLRLEAGMEVFGLPLKIYKRKGEYGRQYIIPIGRLDLLAEDDAGNLYIIELKKDSGYDDAYKQTAAYIDWFEKHHKAKRKKIYGIICVNNPNKKLIEDVRRDERVRLYEYQISYTEIQ